MCQTCVDEERLSQDTFDKIEAFCEKWPHAEFGPAHLVLGDDNVEDYYLCLCLRLAKASLGKKKAIGGVFCDIYRSSDIRMLDSCDWYENHDEDELQATIAFLEELLEVPEDVR